MPGVVGTPVEPVMRLAARMQSRSVPLVVAEVTVELAVVGSSLDEFTRQLAACASGMATPEVSATWTKKLKRVRRRLRFDCDTMIPTWIELVVPKFHSQCLQ